MKAVIKSKKKKKVGSETMTFHQRGEGFLSWCHFTVWGAHFLLVIETMQRRKQDSLVPLPPVYLQWDKQRILIHGGSIFLHYFLKLIIFSHYVLKPLEKPHLVKHMHIFTAWH